MTPEEIILNALKRSEKERGLVLSEPNDYLSSGHIRKADHNLVVMTDLNRLGHGDWVVVTAYYAMYHASLSLLTKIGLQSKDHTATTAVLEYFFGKKIEMKLLEKFNDMKNKIDSMLIEEKYINYLWKIRRTRETVQYGISITYRETSSVVGNTREFVSRIKLIRDELDEKIIKIIQGRIKEMKNSIK